MSNPQANIHPHAKIASDAIIEPFATIGDNVEIGCNAVICPGALIGNGNWVYPNCTVPKGFHAPGYFMTPADHKLLSRPK